MISTQRAGLFLTNRRLPEPLSVSPYMRIFWRPHMSVPSPVEPRSALNQVFDSGARCPRTPFLGRDGVRPTLRQTGHLGIFSAETLLILLPTQSRDLARRAGFRASPLRQTLTAVLLAPFVLGYTGLVEPLPRLVRPRPSRPTPHQSHHTKSRQSATQLQRLISPAALSASGARTLEGPNVSLHILPASVGGAVRSVLR